MARPGATTTTELAYESIAPLTGQDELYDWPLLRYLDGLMRQLDEVEQLTRDTDTHVGWGAALDLDDAPPYAIPWLAQFVGVEVPLSLDVESQRIRISEAAGWRRGTPAAIRGAMRQHLTGSRTTQIFERYQDDPYHLRVRTFVTETPDPERVEEAVRALKPAGIILTYDVSDGQTYDDVAMTYGTYDSVMADHDTYNDILYGIPPEV